MMNYRKKSRTRRNSALADTNIVWRTQGRKLSMYPKVEDSADEDEPVLQAELIDWSEEFFGRPSLANETLNDQDVEVNLTGKQTVILSTLVPDEILLMDKHEAGEAKRFVGVLMMADVSGYTSLSEKYSSIGKSGMYRLTVTLNTYLGALAELIYSHGGDIIKFAGDAFLALWKTDKKSYLTQTIHSVIACALVIQHSYAIYETDVKVNLKVKLAIAAGNLMFSTIGAGLDMSYIIFGLPVLEAKAAESVCASGEVKLTPTAWAHCYSRNYDYVLHDDGHVTIKCILYDPNDSDVSKPFYGFATLLRQVKKPSLLTVESYPDHFWDSSKKLTAIDVLKKNEALSLRPTILKAEKQNIGGLIRNYTIRPVLTQIDAHQPIEYLTEMRQVSITFVTLKPRECSPTEFITIVNNSYKITCEIVSTSMGCVNKIILFDKDVMILIVFGLRGFKHESEAKAALKCAYSIRKSVLALDGVQEVSVGVTTGQVYCGVVGHPLRREFTVIGAVVNKAARLMCYFRNRVSCDEATFVNSKMSKNSFTLLPRIELKGIVNAGKLYEYSEDIRVKEMNNISVVPPLLNRADEVGYFEWWLEQVGQFGRESDGLLLIGEPSMGKSRLLEWLARTARHRELNTCCLSLTSIHSANSYLALSQIVNQLLNITDSSRGFIKEQKIVEMLNVYDEDLCYLNSVIKVRFAYHEGAYSLTEKQRQAKAKNIFFKLMNCIKEPAVLLLDDLQNLDPVSWEFISIMLKVSKIFTVMTVTRGKFSSVHKWLYNVFISGNIRKVILEPLEAQLLPALACQIMDVSAVPSALCSAIRMYCKGVPGLVEAYILHLFSSGAIDIKKITDEELEEQHDEDLLFPDTNLLKVQAVNVDEQATLDQIMEENETADTYMCIITNSSELNTNFNVNSADGTIMVLIDSLTPYQQLLLKIGSVIGNIICRDLLENIMYENDPVVTAKAIKRLFAMRIFSCANARRRKNLSEASYVPGLVSHGHLDCECSFDFDEENEHRLPKYSFCKLIKFRSKASRQTVYDLLPLNQKKEFHARVVNYLENQSHKCSECGGTLNILHSISVQIESKVSASQQRPNFSELSVSKETLTSSNGSVYRTQSENVKSSNAIDANIQKSFSTNTNVGNKESRLPSIASNDSIMSSVPNSSHRGTMSIFLFRPPEYSMSRLLIHDTGHQLFRDVVEATNLSAWHKLGVIDSQDGADAAEFANVQRNDFSIKIEQGTSQIDFMKCTCSDVNILIYEELIHHAIQAELKFKAIEFIIHYIYLCLLMDNTSSALDKLEMAASYITLEAVKEGILTTYDYRKFLGRMYSLKSATCLLNGSLLQAKWDLERALRIYKIRDLKSSKLFKLKNMIRLKRQKSLEREKDMKVDAVFCLNVATSLYIALGDEKASKLYSTHAIYIIESINCRVLDICEAFSNAVQIEVDRGYPEGTLEIERKAKHVFHHLPQPLKATELYALGKFYLATFRARSFRGDLASAIRSGFRALVVSDFLHAYEVCADVVPDIFFLLLSKRRIEEAVDTVKINLRLSRNTGSYNYEMWYYALCMDLILDCGLQLESPATINHYAERMLFFNPSGSAWRRLSINMWTYWLRLDVEKKAKKFEAEAFSWLGREDDDASITSLFSALRLAEGMLESLARKIDDLRKVVDLMELRSIADRELSALEKDCKLLRVIYPRWLRLRATSMHLSGRNVAQCKALIHQAMEESRRLHNHMETALLNASMSNSPLWLNKARTGEFTKWETGLLYIARDLWPQLLYRITTL